MNLPDRLHCPDCQGRLTRDSTGSLRCSTCGRSIQIVDRIADFVGDRRVSAIDPTGYRGDPHWDDPLADALLNRIRIAAGARWPVALGDVMELGCGRGHMTRALAAAHSFRSLLAIDSAMDMIRDCRNRVAPAAPGAERPITFATLCMDQDAIRDAAADTVFGISALASIGDVRALLSMVHRALKPNGRAFFVVNNRRYRHAMCQAMAEALVQRFARDGVWPDGHESVMRILAHTRRILLHRDDDVFLSELEEKHLFDSEALEDLGLEVGFATAEALPLDPDPSGGQTARRACLDAGASEDAMQTLAPLIASAGQPFFSLLNRQDSSASNLLWLTKGLGPAVQIFNLQPPLPPIAYAGPEAALGGAAPRWSVELLARDTTDGIVVILGGWCLINTDVLWVRLTLSGVEQVAPVWRPRPDVHDVLNRSHHYHPLNALCSGMDSELLFAGVHPTEQECPFTLDILLANGVVVSGPAPDQLVMEQQMVINH